MATILSAGTLLQLAFPRPPTPITANRSLVLGAALNIFGINTTPKPAAVADLRKDLLLVFLIVVFITFYYKIAFSS
jgi:hypothetical protein